MHSLIPRTSSFVWQLLNEAERPDRFVYIIVFSGLLCYFPMLKETVDYAFATMLKTEKVTYYDFLDSDVLVLRGHW